MNDGMLSQEEIDALLKMDEANDQNNKTKSQNENDSTQLTDHLTEIEADTLGEIGNISFGSSATTLSTLLEQKVEITTPHVSLINRQEVDDEFNFDHLTIEVEYIKGFSGKNVFVMFKEDAAVISDIMLGGDGTNPDQDLNDIHISAVEEAMNQMMGAAATSMSTVFDKRIDISSPTIKISEPPNQMDLATLPDDNKFIKVSFQLTVGSLINSSIMQLIPVHFAKNLTKLLLGAPDKEPAYTSEVSSKDLASQPGTYDKKSDNTNKQFKSWEKSADTNHQTSHSGIQEAAFTEFEPVSLPQTERRNLNMLLDVQLEVSVELGRTKRPIKDILDFSAGSIIELDKLAGEPVDILINNKLIARGEVVVIEENFGVRITDIISQSDRLQQLK